ncbi:tripartite tricarboxylate transporter TctB family protein [Leucothrix arctica]|uniref:DUF1468 domain-containing protein n=1 Tax=Leucothrix arctica TaxID=1481894 RepID=A0A317CM87_9GAMM|nr:tripartite tricarboxylate transporter TctB family protein [Leucothrix arctica]PWQ99644.1 hypothetical protein DKT75_00810 [Leucothrix arctica]
MTSSGVFLRGNVSSITTLLIGLFFFLSIPSQIGISESTDLSGVNSRTMPYLIASAIILLSLYTIVSNIFANRKVETVKSNDEPNEITSYGRVFLAFVAIALWIVIVPYLGFNITTIMLVTTIMIIIGKCRWWQIAIVALALSFPINYLLAAVLKVYLPSGSVFG